MLRKLSLHPVYDSSEHNLINDLMIPLLQNSISYLRGVGFFTSGWLKLAAQGITELINKGGKARIVMSPILQESDWKAFQLGEEAKGDEKLKEILSSNIDDIASSLENDTLNALAWMISDNLLEFKFAVSRDYNSGSDYHDKVGVFTDEKDDVVAIHGSFNDSIKGSLNGEAFSVFKSWDEGQIPFVNQHQNRLQKLWKSGNSQFRVYSLPEAIKRKFINLRTTSSRPYFQKSKNSSSPIVHTRKPNLSVKLYPYQKKAIDAWLQANCCGVFEMATGTGKTFTSLAAAINRYEELGRLGLIILVPYLHLLEQWENNCKDFGFQPILCSSEHGKWQIEVKSKIQDYNLGAIDNVCMLVVHATGASQKFAKAIKNLKTEQIMIIGDEVHGLGASFLRNAMIPDAGMRLGLSATPQRWYDDIGTNVIFSYFGEICFVFSLDEAIGTYLTPYVYNPELVYLSVTEMETYEELTDRISVLMRIIHSKKSTHQSPQESLKRLLLERALLIASAEGKEKRLLEILREMIDKASTNNEEIGHMLIYCAPGSHKRILSAVAQLGLRCHEFVHTVKLKERQEVLNQFTNGDIQVIIAVKCLDEGVDVPSTKAAFFLASTTNPKEFVQRRGRVLRLAQGKSRADIYDFIVVPRPEYVKLKRDVDASLLKREMPRFAEFAGSAINEFKARSKIRDLLNSYELLNLFDEKPWDIYNSYLRNNKNVLF